MANDRPFLDVDRLKERWGHLANPSYVQLLRQGKPRFARADQCQAITGTTTTIELDPARCQDVQRVLRDDSEQSLLLPYVAAFPWALSLLTHPQFPVNPMGAVATGLSITRQRLLAPGPWQISGGVQNYRETTKGTEFDLLMELADEQGPAWRAVATNLIRQPDLPKQQSRPRAVSDIRPDGEARWQVPTSVARRFALLSGDINPIHLHQVTARAFGFQRAVAHGAWTMGRCLAELADAIPEQVTATASFKKPMLLPAKVTFRHWQDQDQTGFDVIDEASKAPHVRGSWRAGGALD